MPFVRRSIRPVVVGLLTLAGVATSADAARLLVTASVAPRAARTHNLHVGMSDHHMTVRGQGRGSDDLECWVFDSNGKLVDRDVDATDYCILDTPGLGTHQLVVMNVGRYTNRYVVNQVQSLD